MGKKISPPTNARKFGHCACVIIRTPDSSSLKVWGKEREFLREAEGGGGGGGMGGKECYSRLMCNALW